MPVAPKTTSTSAPNAAERQSFLDNLVAGLPTIRASDYWVGTFAFGGKADRTILRGACPLLWSLLGVKRTWACALHMSASDPKRTSSRGGNPTICLGLSIVVNRRRRATCSDAAEADSR